jgi:4-hydroxyproline epimerase
MSKTFFCIDAHTCGNPVRVVAGGAPPLHGSHMSEKRKYFMEHCDWIRTGLMFEPRGHDMMSGSMIYPPSDPQNDAGILFIETSGCLPMCGHGTIGTVTVAMEHGLIKAKKEGELRLEVPAGLIHVKYKMEAKKVVSVSISNVVSWLELAGLEVSCPGLGNIKVDISYGGNFYAIVDPQENYPGLEHFTAAQLIEMSRPLRERINQQVKLVHPENPNIYGCSHILWTGATIDPSSTARNAVFYGDKAIDRSPCGTGTSARLAQWHTQGRLNVDDTFIHESYIGSKFVGRIEQTLEYFGKKAIVPSIEGWAKIYGYNTISIDPEDDPYALGFQVI